MFREDKQWLDKILYKGVPVSSLSEDKKREVLIRIVEDMRDTEPPYYIYFVCKQFGLSDEEILTHPYQNVRESYSQRP